jgi:hypothetical protein
MDIRDLEPVVAAAVAAAVDSASGASGVLFTLMAAAYEMGHEVDVQVDLLGLRGPRLIVLLHVIQGGERVVCEHAVVVDDVTERTKLLLLGVHVDCVLRRQRLWVARQNLAIEAAERSVRERFPALKGFTLRRLE